MAAMPRPLLLSGLLFVACRKTPKPEEHAPPATFAPVYVDPKAASGATSPSLSAAGKGAWLSWIEPDERGPSSGGRVRVAHFEAGAWSESATAVQSEQLLVNWADVPTIAEASGRIVVVFPERTGGEGYRASLVASKDGGKTFDSLGPLHGDGTDTEHGFVSFVREGESLRAFWLDGRATGASGATRLYTAIVGDKPENEALLDDRVCDCCGLGAASSGEGPIVAYRDRSEDEVRDIAVVRGEGKTFSAPRRVAEDGFKIPGCPVNGPSVAAEGRHVAVAWYTYANDVGRVFLSFSTDAGATFSAPIEMARPSGGEAPLGRVSVVLSKTGGALVSYLVAEREDASLVLRRALSNGSLGAPETIAKVRVDRSSGFPKMVRLDDALLLAWTEGAPSRLRAALVPEAAVPAVAEALPSKSENAPAAVGKGDMAPNFEVKTLAGEATSLAAMKGKTTLVNLWATYCEPCRQEMGVLAKLHETYAKRGLVVVGIAMDHEKPAAEIRAFATRKKIPHAIWLDPDDRAGRALGAPILPATFLIDAEGKITFARRGSIHEGDAELGRAIEEALQAKKFGKAE